jgi:hypothetical protein
VALCQRTTGSSRELAGYVWHAPIATDFCGAAKYRDVPHKRSYALQYRLVVLQIEFAGMDR